MNRPSDKRSFGLSPQKQALLDMMLRQAGLDQEAARGIPRRQDKGPAPTSFAQQRLWFLDQLAPNNSFYNLSTAVRFQVPLNLIALERAINEIVRRHEALRTTFGAIDGQPMQYVALSLAIPLPVFDLRTLPPAEREAEAVRLATEESRKPFNLRMGPLVRTTLLVLDAADNVFLLTLHHIGADAWSINLFAQELAAIYTAFLAGLPSPLPELAVQYADYALWQRGRLQGSLLDEQLAYWKQQLGGLPTLEVPTDRPRPPVPSFRGALHDVVIHPALVGAVKALSQERGVTPFMTMLAAFSALMHRYTGQDDIVLGAPIAGRNRAELEGLIGFFVNTLVLRIDNAGDPAFHVLLDRVREVTLGAYAHQDVPFEKLVQELQPQRDLSRNPLCQAVFQLLSDPGSSRNPASSSLPTLGVQKGTAVFDIVFTTWESADQVLGHIEYATDLFDAATIARLASHYLTLLAGAVANPGLRLSELPLLGDEERRRLTVEWNATAAHYEREACIHHLFEACAQNRPDAVAVSCAGESLSYRELEGRSNQLAAHLRAIGCGIETVVGLCMDRSLEMIVGILGILKAGGAFLPLDPTYPQQRLRYMLQDASARFVLTQERLLDKLPVQEATAVCLDRDWPDIAVHDSSRVATSVCAHNLAYVIYTSGSTGQPKGVMVEHSGLCNVLAAQVQVLGVRPDSRVLQFSSSSFDASVFEIVMALGTGAALYVGSRDTLMPGQPLARLLRDNSISVVTLPPSALLAMPFEPLPALETVTVAGESCPAEVVAAWAPGRKFFNLYGPTEATIWTTVAECVHGGGRPLIGHPIANVKTYVLDRHLNPVPVGVPGELYIGGAGLARGYIGRPGLTAEKFVPSPFATEPGSERLYKTGDLVRYLPDGNIDFIGRIDHQVKLRGFRIEPGEIEMALRQHPGVREAVVVVREDGPDDKRLVAYLVGDQAGPLASTELRAWLRRTLPEYMVPAALVTMDGLPRMPSGKIDRQALPRPGPAHTSEKTYVAPENELQRAIAEVWQEVIGVDQVGLHDNFFDLGGHSLLMTRVQSKLSTLLNTEVSMIDLFKYPTINSLAQHLHSEQRETPGIDLVRDRAEKQKAAIRRRQGRAR